MMTSPSRKIVTNKTSVLKRRLISTTRIFISGEFSVTLTSASSILPFAKDDTLMEFEKRIARKTSRAAACSGLILILNPNSSLIKRTVLLYSGLRIRAMVCLAPNFFANKQQIIFTSSVDVAAINKSLEGTRASNNVSKLAPFPCTPTISS